MRTLYHYSDGTITSCAACGKEPCFYHRKMQAGLIEPYVYEYTGQRILLKVTMEGDTIWTR